MIGATPAGLLKVALQGTGFVRSYLSDNYARNHGYAKFCMK